MITHDEEYTERRLVACIKARRLMESQLKEANLELVRLRSRCHELFTKLERVSEERDLAREALAITGVEVRP